MNELFYYIDMDERGEFSASVRDADDNIVLEIEDSIFVDGFMRHKHDMRGLLQYMQSLGFKVNKLTIAN